MPHLLLLAVAGVVGADVEIKASQTQVMVSQPRPIWIIGGMGPMQSFINRWNPFPGRIWYPPAAVMKQSQKVEVKVPAKPQRPDDGYPYRSTANRRWWNYPVEKPSPKAAEDAGPSVPPPPATRSAAAPPDP